MTIDNWVKIAGFIESITASLAIIIGGIWAYRKFVVAREFTWNINLEHDVISRSISSKTTLVSVELKIKNVGCRSFTPGDKGLQVRIKRFHLSKIGRIDWEHGEEAMESFDVLKKYITVENGSYDDEYTIDAGGVYNERVDFVLENGVIYMMQFRLHGKQEENYQTEYVIIGETIARDCFENDSETETPRLEI